MSRWQFRLRTLLTAVAVIALTAGGLRWWYDGRIAEAEYERQERLRLELSLSTDTQLSYFGSDVRRLSRYFDERLFRRVTNAYCEGVDDFAAIAPRLDEFTSLRRLVVLGRQIIPHARRMRDAGSDAVIESLRRHPSLQEIVVDASIRGAPLDVDIRLYMRDDLALLKELLPNLQVEWIEAN